jgi:hypothetical protein
MFELMLFRLPYEGASMMSIVYKLVNNPSQNALTDARGAHGRGHTQYSQAMYACVEAMLHKRPQQRATLPELLSRQVLLHHARGGGAPKRFIDLLEEGAAQMSGRLPDVYSFGRGGTRPRLRDDLMGLQIRQVACGAAHCAVVAVSGEVFTWGRNECGQLGHGDRKQLSLRRRVLFAEEVEGAVVVRGVACGFAHASAHHGAPFPTGARRRVRLCAHDCDRPTRAAPVRVGQRQARAARAGEWRLLPRGRGSAGRDPRGRAKH